MTNEHVVDLPFYERMRVFD